MRIGQLARRLGIPPSEISGFLSDNNIETESGTNSRLEDEVVAKVIHHFAPEKLSEILQTTQEPAPPIVEEQPLVEESAPVAETPETSETPVEETAEPTQLEVIRVAKVELQGLKVVGKIDLPQPKKKEEAPPVEEETANSNAEPAPARPPRREFQKRNERRDREWQNPTEQKRQHEQREAERKRQEEAERLKEKRTNHYYNKVKSVPTKAVRKVEEQTVVEEIEMQEPPKTVIGKFLRWLRT